MARRGEVIDGKYEILREIGRGGMSVVYLAMDKRLNKQWAIKEFRKDKDDVSKQIALKALMDEAALMKKLDHPTLPRIVDIIDVHDTVYIVMDYIEGESLNKVLAEYGAQPQEAVIEWAKQLCDVLDYLHTQNPPIIYRDMKPANIMLKPDGTIRLIDFGIAREYKEGKEGDTEAIGTRGYAAPEQFGGHGQTDARTDIYSLGVTLYHLVTGKNPAEPPYEIYPIRHWNPSLSSGLEWLISKCTQLNPNDRYQSCAEVAYVLDNLEKFEVTYKKKQKSRVNLFIVTAVLALVFAVSSVSSFLGDRALQRSNYDANLALDTYQGYQTAIASDDSTATAYLLLVQKMRDDVMTIGTAAYQEETMNTQLEEEMSVNYIQSVFSNEHLASLRENDVNAYVQVNYEIGRLLWNTFKGSTGTDQEPATQARPYFERVIETVGTADPSQFGLTDQKYNLARSYYLVTYFQYKLHQMSLNKNSGTDDGAFTPEDAAIVAGIYTDGANNTIDNIYYSYWRTCKEHLQLLASDDLDMSTAAKLESLSRLAYILLSTYPQFRTQTANKEETVDVAEWQDMIDAFSRALAHVQAVENDEITRLNEIKTTLNQTITEVNAAYNSQLEAIA